jgi:hypothetical protein
VCGCSGELCWIFPTRHVNNYYKLLRPRVSLDTTFVKNIYDGNNIGKILLGWWKEDKKFVNRNNGCYEIANLQELYMYLMKFLCCLYGEKGCSRFSYAFLPLAYIGSIT